LHRRVSYHRPNLASTQQTEIRRAPRPPVSSDPDVPKKPATLTRRNSSW